MTNGEKLRETFPNIEIVAIVPNEIVVTKKLDGDASYTRNSFRYEWWFAEYKEPTTKKCATCAYREINGKPHEMCKSCVCGDRYKGEPTTKNDLGIREFEGIEITYPPEEVCTYPEYKGKPYFGIKYKENGEEIVGYGTYNSEVLSQYLKDYFISTTKNDLGVDCISRQAVVYYIKAHINEIITESGIDKNAHTNRILRSLVNGVKTMPSVKPQEPILDKIRAEIKRQEKWLMDAGYNAYNVDIAFNSIKSVINKYKADRSED